MSDKKTEDIKTVLATKKSIVGVVADITDTITKGVREFRILTLSVDGTTKTFAINEKFYLRNKDRVVPDAALVVEYEVTVEGKTHWMDGDVVKPHTYSGENVQNITRATTQQSKMMLLDNLEARLIKQGESNPNMANAFATLYGNMLR